MIVNFHTDPVDFDAICTDLANDGVVVVETTRPNFSKIASAVIDRMHDDVLPLSVEGNDLVWRHYLINTEVESFETSVTGMRVIEAVGKWQAVGSPFPFRVRV